MSKFKLFLVCLVVLAVAATGCGTTPSGGREGVKGSAKYYKGAADKAAPGYDLVLVEGEITNGYGKLVEEIPDEWVTTLASTSDSRWNYVYVGTSEVDTKLVTAEYDGVLSTVEAGPEAPTSEAMQNWKVDSPAAYKELTDLLPVIYPPLGEESEVLVNVDLSTVEGWAFLTPSKYYMFSSSLREKISSRIQQPDWWEDLPPDHPLWYIELYVIDYSLYVFGLVDATTGKLLLFDYGTP